ncbi:zinc-ribbon domain-containing protein [Nocardioides sp.]|uniref:zinc-ribbon domain-containing protein n=1 Tax=Nocardioides sp. TaxID=35761 RepID=UPI003514AB38
MYSNRKAWWRCSAGHEWESTVNNRTHGQGCPECAERGGFNPGRPGYVYLLEHSALGALKVGVTNEGTTRLAMFQARAWQVLNLEYFSVGADAAAVERAIKAWWRRDLGLPAWLGPAEMSATGGWTETIASAELAAADCIERVRAEGAAARARSRSAAASDGIASLA